MIPKFDSIDGFFDFCETEIKGDKSKLIRLKRLSFKKADSVINTPYVTSSVQKGNNITPGADIIADIVLNTTRVYDSHGDVHIDGLWDQSLKMNPFSLHLQEHTQSFTHIISDNVKAYTTSYSFKELGYDFNGVTQALKFDSQITKDRNPYMYGQYIKGYVKQHSVGMYYVNIEMCVDTPDKNWKDEKKNWDKYIELVANKEDVYRDGMFWAVREAKLIEGSAVPLGSNHITPTRSVTEAGVSTSGESGVPTLDLVKLQGTKFINF